MRRPLSLPSLFYSSSKLLKYFPRIEFPLLSLLGLKFNRFSPPAAAKVLTPSEPAASERAEPGPVAARSHDLSIHFSDRLLPCLALALLCFGRWDLDETDLVRKWHRSSHSMSKPTSSWLSASGSKRDVLYIQAIQDCENAPGAIGFCVSYKSEGGRI